MRSGEYNLYNQTDYYVAEDDKSQQWTTKENPLASSSISESLEDEILVLRNRMERLFMQEQSFTSDIVIEISSLLDLKINEFMKSNKKY
ncbi:aspartyl-phosphate phosphatase Spo0E family protein [Paenibacillus zeisoli]|uniref:Aspartyl-phosphate phosphatase Spo0E family protein n=1 Tax=Paenibacillus zeisoli TaxID=2496267 RepID=A0A433X326_9BACL|nr:aspartyl-phosphate phosphatase Spo0E family protein [Paenibacillus zeisoli]RUT28474.1 aspartyl-phosphate phosphatase Spo0E family protein [Paenibacillus zeisoli]